MSHSISPSPELTRPADVGTDTIFEAIADADFNGIALLAATLCDAPIGLAGLCDGERHWYPGQSGWPTPGGEQHLRMFEQVLDDAALLEVADVRLDVRFHDNSLVTGAPYLRFFAAVPLLTAVGQKLGSLYVIDTVSRILSERQKAALTTLAHQTTLQFESRLLARRLAGQVALQVEEARGIARASDLRTQDAVRQAASERRLRTITDNVPALIGYIDAQERLQFCNVHYRTMFGFDTEKILGHTLREVFGDVMYATMAPHAATALAGHAVSFERSVTTAGREMFHQVEYVPEIDAGGTVHGFYSLVTDVTARRTAERRLADSEHSLRTITDNLPVAITYIDADQDFRFANATMHAWTGTLPENVIGKSLREVLGQALYESRRSSYERALAGERVEITQAAHWFQHNRVLRSVFVPDFAADGSVRGMFTLSSDITAQNEIEAELRRLARFDSLTGLPNRAYLYELLETALGRSKRNCQAVAVLFLDIDHFKSINDTLGHRKGDLVLQEFAARLSRSVRTTDMVGRLAGDEFVIALELLASQEEAEQVARKILQEIRKPWVLNGQRLTVTTSIGIAFDRDHAQGAADLIAAADSALYAAKALGRNTFQTRIC
ncbi:MAG: diguanylate cyclase [Herminiimonas sp.]|nr:diguanylate cyclase [Herminiimonas sp.]